MATRRIIGTFVLASAKKHSVRYDDPGTDPGLPSAYIGSAALRAAGIDVNEPPKKGRYILEFDDED